VEDLPRKREGRVPSYLPFLLILLVAFGGLSVSANVASSTPKADSSNPRGAVGVQQASSVTVQGEVLEITSKFEGSSIYSYVTLLVNQVVTGPSVLRGTQIILRVLGGEVNGTLLLVSGQPCFFVGEKVEISARQEGSVYIPTSQKRALVKGPLILATTAGYVLEWYKPGVGWQTSTTRPGSD